MHSINSAPTAKMHSHHEHALKSPPAQKPGKSEESPRPSASPATESREAPEKTRAKGVLRLIEEGHFSNGVAAIRLRTNFRAELLEKDADAQTESVRTAAMKLQNAMSATLAETADEPLAEPVKALFEEFDQTISDSLNNEAAAGPDINAAVLDALATLRQGLAALPDDGDAPVQSVPSAIGETETAPTAALEGSEVTDDTPSDPIAPQPFVQSLLVEIDQLAETFQNSADSMAQLSSIEGIMAPAGNGVAFEKFIEQYQAQFGSSDGQNDPSSLIDDHA
jgi:hypothetical protein